MKKKAVKIKKYLKHLPTLNRIADMKSFHFKKLWTEQGWKENVSISINSKGFITSFKESVTDLTGNEITINLAIPGIPNAHSHAFQYAMVGLAEKHPIGKILISGVGERQCMILR